MTSSQSTSLHSPHHLTPSGQGRIWLSRNDSRTILTWDTWSKPSPQLSEFAPRLWPAVCEVAALLIDGQTVTHETVAAAIERVE